MEKIIVGVCMAPRIQNAAFLGMLHGIKEHIAGFTMVGSFADEGFAELAFEGLLDCFPVARTKIKPNLGVQRTIQLKNMAGLLSENQASGVLFLDDDAFITSSEIETLQRITTDDRFSCAVGFQPGLYPDIKKLNGRVAFDFFCTYLPRGIAELVLTDLDVLRIMPKIQKGGECFLLDWILRRKYGVVINTMIHGPFHAYRHDKHKVWGGWSFEKWDKLYQNVSDCCTIKEFETLFKQEKLIDE